MARANGKNLIFCHSSPYVRSSHGYLFDSNTLLTTQGFVKTITTYNSFSTLTVTAGIGQYDPSFIQQYEPSMITMVAATMFTSLYNDTTSAYPLEPVLCSGDGCSSFLFPGSWQYMTPWPPNIYTGADPHVDVMIVHDVYGIQVDYWDVSQSEQLDSNSCKTYGSEAAALEFCIASSTIDSNNLIIGSNSRLFLS